MNNQYEFAIHPNGEWRRLLGNIDGEMMAVIRAADVAYESMGTKYSESFYLQLRKAGDTEFKTFYISATVHVEYFWREAREGELSDA